MSKTWPELPFWAWEVLAQMRAGAVFDGDLISKPGRDALVAAGLARRDRQFECGCQRNELTAAGMTLAMRYAEQFRPSKQ